MPFHAGSGLQMSKEERVELWEEAHRKTIGWLFETGIIDTR